VWLKHYSSRVLALQVQSPEFEPQSHQKQTNKKARKVLATMTYTYNPSFSGSRDQEDRSSRPAWANNLRDLISKKPIIKKGWWSGTRCRP
jgi:hypothetical protein